MWNAYKWKPQQLWLLINRLTAFNNGGCFKSLHEFCLTSTERCVSLWPQTLLFSVYSLLMALITTCCQLGVFGQIKFWQLHRCIIRAVSQEAFLTPRRVFEQTSGENHMLKRLGDRETLLALEPKESHIYQSDTNRKPKKKCNRCRIHFFVSCSFLLTNCCKLKINFVSQLCWWPD